MEAYNYAALIKANYCRKEIAIYPTYFKIGLLGPKRV